MIEKNKLKNLLTKVKQNIPRVSNITLRLLIQLLAMIGLFFLLVQMPETAHASVESSLMTLKSKLTGFILPVLSVIGLGVAGASFMMGSENAKKNLAYASIGCALAFGAQAIVDFISSTVV